MNFKIGKDGEIKVILVFRDQEKVEKNKELYLYIKEKEVFKGKLGEVYINIFPEEEKVIFLGLGEKDKVTIDLLRKAFYNLGKKLMKYKVEAVGIDIALHNEFSYKEMVSSLVEGLLQSEYSFEKYLSVKKVIPTVKNVYFNIDEDYKDDVLEAIRETEILMEGVNLARELINERPIKMYPEILVNSARDELKDVGVKVEIFDKEEIEKLNMKAFLAVSQGSSKEPRFLVMTYEGDPDSDEKLAYVGKGLTYDSGGYSLKPTKGMDTMFIDMSGSAVVIGAIKSIAKAKLKRNVVGIVAACENLVSGNSYKPGDIVESMSGRTIEVINSDAEGRLTLADALWYASTVVKADKIVDLATLTGSCVVALGNLHSGAITNNKEFYNEVNEAAKLSGELIWELPNNQEYKELNKSKYADLINDDDSGAGAISAGLFLGEFVKDKPWVHLDIAGTSFNQDERGYLPKGATGVHVKTLFNLAKNN